MSFPLFRWIGAGFKFLWNALDTSRKIFLNILTFFILLAIAIGIFGGGLSKLEDKTSLILDFKGPVVEQHSGNARDALLAEAQGNAKKYDAIA